MIKGEKHKIETIEKIRRASIGRNLGLKRSPETIEKMRKAQLGKVHSFERRKNVGDSLRGIKSHFWKGGIYPENLRQRKTFEYKLWRKAVFERDGFACVECKSNKSGSLQADHIKPFALYPELRLSIDNGRTLCKDCHKKTDTWGFKIKNYKNNPASPDLGQVPINMGASMPQ